MCKGVGLLPYAAAEQYISIAKGYKDLLQGEAGDIEKSCFGIKEDVRARKK